MTHIAKHPDSKFPRARESAHREMCTRTVPGRSWQDRRLEFLRICRSDIEGHRDTFLQNDKRLLCFEWPTQANDANQTFDKGLFACHFSAFRREIHTHFDSQLTSTAGATALWAELVNFWHTTAIVDQNFSGRESDTKRWVRR